MIFPNIAEINERKMREHPEHLEAKWREFAIGYQMFNPKKMLLSDVWHLVFKLNYLVTCVRGVNIPRSYLQAIADRLIGANPDRTDEIEVMLSNVEFNLKCNLQMAANNVKYFFEEAKERLFYDEVRTNPINGPLLLSVNYTIYDVSKSPAWVSVHCAHGVVSKMTRSKAGADLVKYYNMLNNQDKAARCCIENGDLSSREYFHLCDLMKLEFTKTVGMTNDRFSYDIEIETEDVIDRRFDGFVIHKRITDMDQIPYLSNTNFKLH